MTTREVRIIKSIGKHITLYKPHVEILDSIIESEIGVTNYSEAIRFLCMTYEKDSPKSSNNNQAKLNAMGKEISILSVLIGELAAYQILEEDILGGTESKPYLKAKKIVEEEIKRNQTKKYSAKKDNSVGQMNLLLDPFKSQLNQSN